MVELKTANDLFYIRKACEIWKQAKEYIESLLKNDVHRSLKTLDHLIDQFIKSKGGTSTFYQKYGFPGHICMSVNDCVIHGIPNDYVLQDTDKITFDMGVTYHHHVCDAAFNWLGKDVPDEQRQIIQVCEQSLLQALKVIKPGARTGDIAHAIGTHVKSLGYFILDGFTGHGCGNELHEDPAIYNDGKAGTGILLKPGMVICIEPMILANSEKYTMQDQWNVTSVNHNPTAHVESMLLITETGYEILA